MNSFLAFYEAEPDPDENSYEAEEYYENENEDGKVHGNDGGKVEAGKVEVGKVEAGKVEVGKVEDGKVKDGNKEDLAGEEYYEEGKVDNNEDEKVEDASIENLGASYEEDYIGPALQAAEISDTTNNIDQKSNLESVSQTELSNMDTIKSTVQISTDSTVQDQGKYLKIMQKIFFYSNTYQFRLNLVLLLYVKNGLSFYLRRFN